MRPRERALLILIDGQMSDDVAAGAARTLGLELDAIDELARRGLIERTAPGRAPAATAKAASADHARAPDEQRIWAAAKLQMLGLLDLALGGRSSPLRDASRLAVDEMSLLAWIEHCLGQVETMAGMEASDKIRQRMLDVLPAGAIVALAV
ncbi:MAG TPA: hypothetical protein VFV25_13500 [Methylibium sp.]